LTIFPDRARIESEKSFFHGFFAACWLAVPQNPAAIRRFNREVQNRPKKTPHPSNRLAVGADIEYSQGRDR